MPHSEKTVALLLGMALAFAYVAGLLIAWVGRA